MNLTVYPQTLQGSVTVPASKSQAHRILICAAFADGPTEVECRTTGEDIEATVGCLQALGAELKRTENGFSVVPGAYSGSEIPVLDCGESGATLRFLLPVAGALGTGAVFRMKGRLPSRPLSPLWEEMERMGCSLRRISQTELLLEGKLHPGMYTMRGDVSSQFISGLLLALPLMDGDSRIRITGPMESGGYIAMTQAVMAQFGVNTEAYVVSAHAGYHSPGTVRVEGDWSSGAFFLAADYLGSEVDLYGLDMKSLQGDRRVMELLPELREGFCTICAAEIPDLIPVLAVVAVACHGAEFTHVRRLRLKESDRVASIAAMLEALGGRVTVKEDSLLVEKAELQGGTVDARSDHRIAMSAGIAAICCSGPVTILGAECVGKSYPDFWEEYRRLGGNYEFDIR